MKKLLKIIFQYILKKFLFFLIIIFRLLIGKDIFLVKLYGERIGHLALVTDYFFRKIQNNNNKSIYIGIIQSKTANEYLIKLIKKKITLLKLPLKIFNFFVDTLRKEKFFKDYRNSNIYVEYDLYQGTNVNFIISDDDKLKGEYLLEKNGISKNDWFVCFHNRTSKYLEEYSKHLYGHNVNFDYHDFRDTKVNTYKEALNFIIDNGGYVIRIGHNTDEKIDFLKEQKYFIDFSDEKRSDFSDIFLSSKCKFFLGSNAGINVIPYTFHKPLITSNHTPIFVSASPRIDTLSIPNIIWSIKENRPLHFKEVFQNDIWKYGQTSQFKENNLKVLKNSGEIILQTTKQLFIRIEKNEYSKNNELEHIKDKFNSILPHTHQGKNKSDFLNTISDSFYMTNKHLIL